MNSPRHVIGRAWPTEALALGSRSIEPRTRPLDEHRSLELSEHASHTEQCSTRRCRRIDTLLVEVEVYTGPAQRLEAFQKLTKGATEPRDIPGEQDLEPPSCRVLQHSVVSGSSISCGSSGNDFLVNLYQMPSGALGNLAKSLKLILGRLFVGRNTREDRGAAHR